MAKTLIPYDLRPQPLYRRPPHVFVVLGHCFSYQTAHLDRPLLRGFTSPKAKDPAVPYFTHPLNNIFTDPLSQIGIGQRLVRWFRLLMER